MKNLQIKTITLLVAAIFLSFSFTAYSNVQPHLQAAIFYKILNYDSAILGKKQKAINIHIVSDAKTASKLASIKSGFSFMKGQKVAGKAITVTTTSVASLKDSLAPNYAHVIYIPSGSSQSTVNLAISLGKSKKMGVLAGDAKLVKKGAAVGITIENGKPKIIVNLKQSKLFGMSLSSQLLKLAKVI